MNDKALKHTSKSVLTSISETEMADMRRCWGNKVCFANGNYWVMTSPGFYRATHWLAKMPFEQACKPTRFCWGFHTTIRTSDSKRANGTLPLHILYNLQQYSMNSLSSRRRNKLKNCFSQVEFVELVCPQLLMTEGYEVIESAQKRTGYRRWHSRERFRKYTEAFLIGSHGKIVAGLVEGRLRGLAFCFAVGSTAYIDSIDIATDALKTNIGSGLVFEVAQIAKRSGLITELVNSPHTPEKPSLTNYKIGMGFDLVHIPSRVWFMPPMESLVRFLKPEAHYRITGKKKDVLNHNQMKTENRCRALRTLI